MSLQIKSRLNSRIIDVMKSLGDLHTACDTLMDIPDQELAQHLASTIGLYKKRADSMLTQVAVLLKHLESDTEDTAGGNTGKR